MWRRPDGHAIVATVDFFTPIVDDARTWGRIAAANAASDIYAMGARPLFALNIAGWPRDELPLELLGEVLVGGIETSTDGGWVVVGGHTTDSPEPHYGQAVIGEIDADAILANTGGRPGDVLVLTKPLGTGIVATALKAAQPEALRAGGSLAAPYDAAVASMTRLNADAARIAVRSGATACTDITGFGLLGHLQQLARASGAAASVDVGAVPLLPGVRELAHAGHVPGGSRRNLAHVRDHVVGDIDELTLTLLCDAQTSGGLLFALPPAAVDDALNGLEECGHRAAAVGSLVDGEPGTLRVG